MSDTPKRSHVPPIPADRTTDTPARGPDGTGVPLSPTDPITALGPGAPGFLGDFTVLQKLGEGGMGAVYLAEDPKLKRKVAIKTMKPELAANKLDRDRFEREARAAAAVESDYIVPILHVGAAPDGTPFIVMPFLRGEMLDARLKRDPAVPLALVLKVALEVAEGLAAAHEVGLIHRDIKPSNIWLEGDLGAAQLLQQVKRCKILDFGLARSVDKEDIQITASGAILGTPAYMAPEQARGEKVDARADLFSLGATLYRTVTGALPFNGPTPMAVLIALATETPRPVRERAPHLPTELISLIDRLMQKDPANRPNSAADVSAAVRALIEALKERRAIASTRSFAPASAPGAEPISTSAPQLLADEYADEETRRPPAKRSPLPWVIAGACLLALVPLGLWGAGVFDGKKQTDDLPKTEKPKDTPKDAPPAVDVERKAAEYVLSVGGEVGIDDGNEHRNLTALEELPKESFRVRRIAADGAQLTDAGLSAFRGCRHVIYVGLINTSAGDAGIANFSECKGLRYLYLQNTTVGDAGLAALKDCSDLLDITLNNTPVTDAGLAHVKRFTKLERLLLDGTKVSAEGVAELAKALPECEITWDGGRFGPEPDRKAAEWVHSVGGCVGLGDDPKQIKAGEPLPKGEIKLTVVIFTKDSKVTNAGLAVFAGCRNLYSVGLNDTRTGDAGLRHFKDSRLLQYLYLEGTDVTAAGLAHLRDCTELLELNLSRNSMVDDAALEQAKRFTKLSHLYLKGTMVTANGVAAFRKVVQNCQIEWDGDGQQPVSDADRKAAEWVLSAGGTVHVDKTGNEVKSADKLPQKPFKVVDINLTKPVKDADLAVIAECKHLTGAYLAGTGITNAGLEHLKGKELTSLFLSGTKVDDKAVPLIKQFTQLTDLSIGQTGISKKGVEEIAKALPGCRIQHDGGTIEPSADPEADRKAAEWVLSIGGNVQINNNGRSITKADALPKQAFELTAFNFIVTDQVNDKELSRFKDCKNLTHIGFGNARVSDAGLANFKGCKGLTYIKIGSDRFSDKGFELFKDCKDLKYLSIVGTAVTNNSVDQIKKYKNLEQLEIAGTKITPEGAEELKKALPNCKIFGAPKPKK